MKSSWFSFLGLALVAVFTLVFVWARFSSFGLDERLQAYQKIKYDKSIAQEKLRLDLLIAENAKLNQNNSPESNRAIASVPGSDVIYFEGGASWFEKGKEAFRGQDFETAAKWFDSVIHELSQSENREESLLLLAESHYQLNQYDKAIDAVEELVDQYPLSQQTGFGLLRLADIYRLSGRPEDAKTIYLSILKQFSDVELKKQADSNLKSLRDLKNDT